MRHWFGHREFRPGQREVIERVLAGRPALAVFPTGGGKSLCYQLPAILSDGLTIVISPLIALMKDQVDGLAARGIPAAKLDSTLTEADQTAIYNHLGTGLKILFTTPERFVSTGFQERMKRVPITLLAVDEAHCISGWGHNFRPEYLKLAKVARRLKIPTTVTLTATATKKVITDICREFRIKAQDRILAPFDRPNLSIHISPTPAGERLQALVDRLATKAAFPTIVYVTLQRTAEHVASHLHRLGFRAHAYHAGLSDQVRSALQDGFMGGSIDVMVATMAFGMGIDKSDVRSVFHFNMPKSPENYLQEIGRAGRDGRPARCEMFPAGDDVVVLKNFLLGSHPDESSLRHLVDHLLRQGTTFDISRHDLARTTDIRLEVIDSVLVYLEIDGILVPKGSFHSKYHIGFAQPPDRILSGHPAARRKFLAGLLGCAVPGRGGSSITLSVAVGQTGRPASSVLEALQLLEESGDISLTPAGIRHRFQLKASGVRPSQAADRLIALFQNRLDADIRRLEKVVSFINRAGCTSRHLLSYFGQPMDSTCGHCGNCLSDDPSRKILPPPARREMSLEHLATIRTVRSECHPALRHPRALARFLCGITSPAVLRDRLTRHDAFGLLEDYPMDAVIAQLEA